jgi:hypothetical protein
MRRDPRPDWQVASGRQRPGHGVSRQGIWGLTGAPFPAIVPAVRSTDIQTGLNRFKQFQKFQNPSNLNQFKKDLPSLGKSEIKFGFEGIGERNNFLKGNFFRFEVDFEWKFIDALWCEFDYNLI